MAFIKQVPEAEASGLLADIYEECRRRAGRVFGIMRVQSLNPRVLKASMELYKAIMWSPSPLSRAQREMMAVVVSRANDCFY